MKPDLAHLYRRARRASGIARYERTQRRIMPGRRVAWTVPGTPEHDAHSALAEKTERIYRRLIKEEIARHA